MKLEQVSSWVQSPNTRYPVLLVTDGLLTVAGFVLAYILRFEGHVPVADAAAAPNLLMLLIAARLASNFIFQLHRWSFRYAGFYDAIRLGIATVLGSTAFIGMVFLLQVTGPRRSILVLEFFFAGAMMGGYRFFPRLLINWWSARARQKKGAHIRTIIVGAGGAGELLLRDLQRSQEHNYKVVGFVDDDRNKWGHIIAGTKVLGAIADLPEQVRKHEVTKILIAIPRLSPSRIREILTLCQDMKVRYKIVPVSFAYLSDRVSASMLQDLTPEDLLPRDSVSFEAEEIRKLLDGRRILVTGAAGSIGSEMCRQAAAHGAGRIVLCDINENELYFLYREMREKHPGLDLHAEVVDIREGGRLQALGRRYLPQYVFHAAAHKHVPLMETAPSEAVRNNVLGTRNVLEMAHACGVERFVLVSTDKAVRPTSVMGATKRVGEYLARRMAASSPTRFTAVRFGNVLGSAGSVVPLFKQQIARGGPITVTDPEVRRYFMTIQEAVGLVLLAGLGGYGDLCVLDMGEPLRIADLARHMLTMAGLVPDVDVKIKFTGLREGEKMTEDLLTEDEEGTRAVRAKVFVVDRCPPPPEDLEAQVSRLAEAAQAQKDEEVVAILRSLIPSYRPYRADVKN